MNATEQILRAIVDQHSIGFAKIGRPLSDLVERYGSPPEVVDPKEFGIDVRCNIYNYGELQVWANVAGIIDRVFFKVGSNIAQCSNPNFRTDMAAVRPNLQNCELTQFKQVLCPIGAKAIQRSRSTELLFNASGIEVFATFLAREPNCPQYLVTLRLNDVHMHDKLSCTYVSDQGNVRAADRGHSTFVRDESAQEG